MRDRLKNVHVQQRVDTCLRLRYFSEDPILQREWIAYCHENYGDKSEKQYHSYWSKAKAKYEEGWRARLDNMLDPAIHALSELLHSDNNQIRQRAIDQVLKYTGNDIQKVEHKGEINITTDWG